MWTLSWACRRSNTQIPSVLAPGSEGHRPQRYLSRSSEYCSKASDILPSCKHGEDSSAVDCTSNGLSSNNRIQVVDTHRSLMRRGLDIAARSLSGMTWQHPFTILVAIWSKTAITLQKHMIPAQHIPSPDVLWATMQLKTSVNTFQWNEEGEFKEPKPKNHYTATK